ncbi:MAG: TIM barrel protein [Acidobacteria bacterium]|nr:TIM barrel protein [Acidobacteriota bacterium]
MITNRRHFLSTGLAAVAAQAAPQPKIRFATSGFIWQENIEEGIRTTARFGFHGIEPFRQHILKYVGKPLELKRQLDAAGISLVTCSNGGTMTTSFIDPSQTAQTIADHVQFARDFIAHFGCRHFKINLGRRPPNPTTEEQLKTMAGTLNEIGRQIAQFGLKLAPHPHIWSPLERENELRRVMELTDPKYVFLVTDTAHLTLGGMDPVRIMKDYYPRIAAIHFKDTEARYRGFRGATPTQEGHRKVNLYKNLGAGGVDFPAIFRLLRARNYEGWITLDLDPPRAGEGTIEENLEVNRRYLQEKLKVRLSHPGVAHP